MIVVKNGDSDINRELSVSYGNIKSRPSKSLLTPDLYNQRNILTPFNIYEKLIDYQLTEVGVYFKRDSNRILSKFTIDTSFSSIITFINEHNCSLFYKLDNLHPFVNIEFVLLTSTVFKKITIYFSKFDYSVFIFCEDKLDKNIDITISDKKYIKSFGIDVPEDLQEQVKRINDNIFINEYLLKSRLLENLTLSKRDIIIKDIELVTNYYLSYIKETDIINDSCNCEFIFKSEILDCRVCEKCYSLYSEESFLSALALDQAAAASENAAL